MSVPHRSHRRLGWIGVRCLPLVASLVVVGAAHSAVNPYVFSPALKYGGRSTAVDIAPGGTLTAIATAEGGGLDKTTNGGTSWTHIDAFPQFRMEDVRYDSGDANVVLATTLYDGRVTAQSGVWRSTDGGSTWARASVPFPCTTQPDAWGIATARGSDVHQKMFVATDCGVAYSNDSGATWSSSALGGLGAFNVVAVRTANDTVKAYSCGPSGVYTTTVTGSATPTWTRASNGYPVSAGGRCGIDIAPGDPSVVFVTNRNCPAAPASCNNAFGVRVWESDDTAATWTEITGPFANNRDGFVVTHPALDGHGNHYDLYWGNGFGIYRQHCVANGTSALDCPTTPESGGQCSNSVDDDGDGMVNEGCPKVGSASEDAGSTPSECKNASDDDGDGKVNDGCPQMEYFPNGSHVDPADLAFDPTSSPGCPLYYSSDGGVGTTSDCGANWTDSNAGRLDLQLYNVWGTVRGSGPTDTDIYFGTQDNNWFFTLDNGTSPWTLPFCCEGFYGQTDHRVPSGGLSAIQMVYVNCSGCNNEGSERGFGGRFAWPNPPGNAGNPVRFGNQRYVQISNNDQNPATWRAYVMQPETGSQCGNAVDDDADGTVNDGCPANGAAETGTQCHNASDDDGDGKVNDGCSHVFSNESGSECSNATDDDGDGVANDACPAVGPDTDGDGNPDPETGAQCLNTSDDDGDGTVNDGCPAVGVWAPLGPTFAQNPAAPIQASGSPSSPTFYFGVDIGGPTFRLMKITGPLNSTATLSNASGTFLSQLTNIGNYCGAGGTWYCPLVWAVDPSNPNKLWAADDATQQMKFSTDGGGTWQPDPELTSLVTNNGEFRWRNGNGTEAWTIGIDPENSNRIFVGTELSGILASADGGTNWFRLTGTLNRVPEVSSFFFDEDHNIEYASSYGRGLWSVSFIPPVAKPGGPYSTVEGTDVTLDGSASFDPDGGALTYSWDFNNDGVFGDATGPKPVFDRVGEEGTYTVWLKVTDPDGATDVAATTVVVGDVPPTVTISSDAPKPEHSLVTVSGVVSDPGWLDPLTARIDWGDGTAVEPISGTLENVRPDATLTFSVTHDYGDNGTFTANVCGNDDNDVCKTISLTITNVVPTAAIDKSGATIINGSATILAHAGQPVTFNGRSTDPGSDDLTVTWHWGDSTPDDVTTYLNNPPSPDPFPSPTVNPRDITDTKTHTFGDACLYTTTFGSYDDDGGVAVPDSVKVLITGNESERFGHAFWKDQYRTDPPWNKAYPASVRTCYLVIVAYVSNVFNEVVDASTFTAAENVLLPKGTVEPPVKQLDRELLAAWLNFANGSVDWTTLIDTDHDGTADTPFSTVMANAETVRLDAGATDSALRAQTQILRGINND
jgi:hypothetical protein